MDTIFNCRGEAFAPISFWVNQNIYTRMLHPALMLKKRIYRLSPGRVKHLDIKTWVLPITYPHPRDRVKHLDINNSGFSHHISPKCFTPTPTTHPHQQTIRSQNPIPTNNPSVTSVTKSAATSAAPLDISPH